MRTMRSMRQEEGGGRQRMGGEEGGRAMGPTFGTCGKGHACSMRRSTPRRPICV